MNPKGKQLKKMAIEYAKAEKKLKKEKQTIETHIYIHQDYNRKCLSACLLKKKKNKNCECVIGIHHQIIGCDLPSGHCGNHMSHVEGNVQKNGSVIHRQGGIIEWE